MDVNAQLEALRLKFIDNLPKRMIAINTSYTEWKNTNDPKALSEFHRLTHSLTGAAATFGCEAVSVAARTLEVQLLALLQDECQVTDTKSPQLDTLLADITTNIDKAVNAVST